MEVSKNIRQQFNDELNALYSEREIENMYRWCVTELGLSVYATHFPSKYLDTMEKWLNELKTGKPIQYVLGNTVFYGRKFNLTPEVLIPRPETEELCNHVIKSAAAGSVIMDIGTGSGCIAITLALELLKCKVMASDVSSGALKTARTNAALHKASVVFVFSDALNTPVSGNVDIIVSNPPYIPINEKALMHKNVLDFEPHQALFVSNTDALVFYRQLLVLNPFVREFWFEIHESKKNELEEMLKKEGITTYTFHNDLQDKCRILHVKR